MICAAVLPRFLPAADSGLLVEGDDALGLDALLRATTPAGVVAVLPGLRSVLVEYDSLRTSQSRLRGDVAALLSAPRAPGASVVPQQHVVRVCYDGPDLADVARRVGLDPADVVRLHCDAEYRVAMLGNLPGLPYLTGLSPQLAVPRRSDPRDRVPAGSVAVAGGMSCIYPAAGPGGWNVIGRTDSVLFDAMQTPPALLAPGDVVRFVAASDVADVPANADSNDAVPVDGGPALHVVEPGLLTTVQDMGRHGHQHLGVPVSGALDVELLRIANLLAGNPPDAAALEVTHTGPRLEVRAPSVRIAVAGACEVACVARDGTVRDVGAWRSTVLRDGERLHVGRVLDGLRCVVAVEGGIDVAPVLGSRSTYLRGSFGGFHGRALRAGDVLPLCREYAGHHPDLRLDAGVLDDLDVAAPTQVRFVPGPQDDALTDASLDSLFATDLLVSPRSDRVGLRLDGLRLHHRDNADIPSEGCAPGSIQVPANGVPIVLLADRGTTGGYPKVATVASVDLPRLARLRPGSSLRLERITVAEAESLRRTREAQLAQLPDALVPVATV